MATALSPVTRELEFANRFDDMLNGEQMMRALVRKDLREANEGLGKQEARYLVDTYYSMQEERKRAKNQERALSESQEPHDFIAWLATHSTRMEQTILESLKVWVEQEESGIATWMTSIVGIGPVITAGLLTTLDIDHAPTAGHFWAFAGLDPTKVWGKGQKRPWNAFLKRLCFNAGECFVKVQNNQNDTYGHVYRERKDWEAGQNAAGAYADQAAKALLKNIGSDTIAYSHYKMGQLPPAHLHSRARRYAVKLFLSHLHFVWYWLAYHELPPNPYPIAILGHGHIIDPPNMHLVPGLQEAIARTRPIAVR